MARKRKISTSRTGGSDQSMHDVDYTPSTPKRVKLDYNVLHDSPHIPIEKVDPYEAYPLNDALLKHFRLSGLREHGYIDHVPSPLPPIDEDLAPNVDYLPSYMRGKWSSIHPVFTNWTCGDDDRVLLTPVLKLATCFLSEPTIQPFFMGLMVEQRLDISWNSNVVKRWKQGFQSFQNSHTHPPSIPHTGERTWDAGAIKTWKYLAKLRHSVSWRFEKLPSSYGTTELCREIHGLPHPDGPTRGSKVEISHHYLEALKFEGRKATTWPLAGTHDPAAALLRTQFHMAITLVHELCHVIWGATTPWKWAINEVSPEECFYRDQRIAEVGFAWESVFFNGVIITMPDECRLVSAPYGLQIHRFPDAVWMNPRDIPMEASPGLWNLKHQSKYLVHMSHVHQFFTDMFWQKMVPMNQALDIFHPPREYGVMVPAPQTLFWDEHESEIEEHTPSPAPEKQSFDDGDDEWMY